MQESQTQKWGRRKEWDRMKDQMKMDQKKWKMKTQMKKKKMKN